MQEIINLQSGDEITGLLSKMQTTLSSPVAYHLQLGNSLVDMNSLIGQTITLSWQGKISCLNCGKNTKKSFGQGHCYNCFRTLAACDQCIMSPERCHFNAGTCR